MPRSRGYSAPRRIKFGLGDIIGPRERFEALGKPLEFVGPTRWECFSDLGVRAILEALAITAPRLVGGVVVLTSTYRRGGGRFSWHQRFAAVDVRTGLSKNVRGELELGTRRGSFAAVSPGQAFAVGQRWQSDLEARLGNAFDVVFGDVEHIDHMHLELDGAKRRAFS